jgi:hypothetical protein
VLDSSHDRENKHREHKTTQNSANVTKVVLAEHRLRDRIHKTKRRESKQTRNKAEQKNQIQQMTPHFEYPGRIASMPSITCSADE